MYTIHIPPVHVFFISLAVAFRLSYLVIVVLAAHFMIYSLPEGRMFGISCRNGDVFIRFFIVVLNLWFCFTMIHTTHTR